MKNLNIFTNGIIRNNPLLVLMIGLCSSLAVTTNILNGLGMGLAMTFVIVMSELIISIFRKLIPQDIRIPVFIIVIASFTTIVDLLMQAYTPALADAMGLFIKLIVVNCIIKSRILCFKRKPRKIRFRRSGNGSRLYDSSCAYFGYKRNLRLGILGWKRLYTRSLSYTLFCKCTRRLFCIRYYDFDKPLCKKAFRKT